MIVAGQFGVSSTGAATYSVPIAVPPGTAGLAPSLSLDYSSQAQDGIVGWQWSLDGLPSIGRCPRTLAQDSIHGSVNYDANDRFCLNGQRLILVGGTYGADGSEYRTEIEAFTRVIAHGTTGTGPTYFDVYTKSGQTLELGNTTDSRLIAVGTTTARAWSVDKISDVSGNYLTVTYTNDTVNGQQYPARIDYTGNAGASVAPYNSVQFTYNTSRPDVTPSYQAGSKQEVTVLLTDIKAFNGATAIRDYKLAYRLGSTTTRSRLTSVTQCDGAGTTCLTPTTFGWQGGTGQLTMTANANTLFQGFNVTPIDYNGDGLTDAIMWGPSTCPNYDVYEGTTSGLTFASVITTAMLGTGTSCAPSNQQDIDIEPDGNGDLLMSYFYLSTGGIPIPTHKVFVLKSSGSAFSTAFSMSSSVAAIAGDFNGDGRADFFSNASGTSFIYFGDGAGAFTPDAGHAGLSASVAADFDGNGCTDLLGTSVNYFCNPAAATATPPTLPSGSTMVFGDFNGDGKTDILVTNTTTTGTLYLSTGTGFAATSFTVPAGWGKYTITTTDIDGDGRSDLILIASGASGMYGSGTPHQVWLSTGTGFVQAVDGTGTPISIANSDTSVSASVADWNNDGAGDFLLKKASGDTQYNFTYVPELMTSVSNGLGATTTVTYDRINKNGTFYTKGSPGTYPIVPIDAAVYVVSQVTSSNGIGGTFSWSYAYGGAYGNVNAYSSVSVVANARTEFAGNPAAIGSVNNGSPLVGFTQVTVTDAQTHVVTTTNYRPDFPYTGLIASQTQVHGATTLASTTNTWSSTNLGGTHNFVFLQQNVVSGHDLDGTALPTRTTSYTYDTFGNALTTKIALSDGSSSTTTDTFTNDSVRWLLGQIATRTVTQVVGTSTLTRTASFVHDPSTALITSATAQPSTNWALTTAYTYDAFGNRLTATVSGAGGGTVAGITSRTTSATYDASGQFMLTATDALNHVDHFTYDARFGTQTSHTDPNGAVTSTTYDAFGRTILAVQPDGTKATTAYTLCPGAGCIAGTAYHVAVTPQSGAGLQNGPAVTQHYDMLNRLLDTESQSFGAAATITVTAYDANGRISQTSRPYLEVGGTPANTTFLYDDLNRPTQATMPDASTNTYAYHGLSTSVTDGLSHTTTTVNNAQGLVASVTDPASHATSYVYDAFGDLATLTDPAGNVLTNTFDIRGNRTAAADPDAGSWSYAYDALGELVSQTDAKAQTTTLTYDLLGRPTQRVEAGLTSTWTWDSALHGIRALASATAGTGYSRTVTYDSLGRPATTTLTVGGTSHVYSTAYNTTNGKIDTVSYPSGFGAKYVYTSLGYLSQIQNAATSAVLFTVNARDAEAHLTQSTFGNGVATTQTFDAHTGRLTNVRSGPSDTVAAFDYTWDAAGNLTYRADDHAGVFERFCYDNLDRLTKAALGVGSDPGAACTGGAVKTVSYDALGDITAKSDVGTYGYPAAGTARPHAVTSIAGTVNGVVNPSFGYDANGNMTTQAGRTVTYTSFNRTASIVQGTTTIGLTYDDGHARVVQTAPGGTTAYLNDPVSGAMSEKVVSGATTTWHDYLQVDGRIAAERFCTGAAPCSTGATMRYVVTDHLGSVAALTDDTGAVAERDAYDAWGRRRNVNGTDDPTCGLTSQTTRGYTGHEMLDAVCQVNANARVYDATLGRFTSVDPMLRPYDGQNFNAYGYVGNNPLSMTDPTGMNTDCPPDVTAHDDPTIETRHSCDDAEPPTLTAPDIPPIGVGGIGNPPPHSIGFHPPPTPKMTTAPAKPNGKNGKMSDDEREAEAEKDYAICRKLADPGARSRCWASAAERDAARATGRPLPPLINSGSSFLTPDVTRALKIGGGVIIIGGIVILIFVQPEIGVPAAAAAGGL